MAQDFAAKFYKSHRWQVVRETYLMSIVDTDRGPCPPGVCERCFSMGRLEAAKVVHHKVHLTPENIDDPEVTLGFRNLQRLCQACHAYVHSDGRARVAFDERGEAIPFFDTLEEQVIRLTATEEERRNIHKGERR